MLVNLLVFAWKLKDHGLAIVNTNYIFSQFRKNIPQEGASELVRVSALRSDSLI